MWRISRLSREGAWFVSFVAVLVAAAVLAFFVLPQVVVSPADLRERVPAPAGAAPAPAASAVDLVQARNGARTAAVALLAAVGAALATGFAVRTYYLSRRSQLIDRSVKAFENLGADAEPTRVAAVMELEAIASHSPDHRRRVMTVLAAFVREQKRSGDEPPSPGLQAACTLLGKLRARSDRKLVLDLNASDLRQVNLDDADLRHTSLRNSKLSGTFLRRADLRDADLTNAVARSVRLDGADLRKAALDGAQLQGATLDKADAREATFRDVSLRNTFMRGADLRKAEGLVLESGGIRGAVVDEHTRHSE